MVIDFGSDNGRFYEGLTVFCEKQVAFIAMECDKIFERLHQCIRRQEAGKVLKYYPRIGVAVITLTRNLSVGQPVFIEGKVTSFEQTTQSMEIDHKPVSEATGGMQVAIKVISEAREDDILYELVV